MRYLPQRWTHQIGAASLRPPCGVTFLCRTRFILFCGRLRILAVSLPLKVGTRIAICALQDMALPEEFLIMDPPTFPGEDDSGSSPFDTMWTEFARSHPRLSPPRTPSH